MSKSATSTPRAVDLALAAGLLTRLPVSIPVGAAERRGAAAAWAYPLAGALVGAGAAAVQTAAALAGLPPALQAGLALTAATMLTGALHEDGLADCADGFWGGWTPERRLEIMKDSRTGAYGVLALVFTVMLRWSALTAVLQTGPGWPVLLAAGVVSRAGMVVLWASLPPARPGGLAARVGRPRPATAALALGLGLLAAFACLGAGALAALAVSAIALIWLGRSARVRIGGQTGDVLGAAQQLCETAVLLSAAAFLAQ